MDSHRARKTMTDELAPQGEGEDVPEDDADVSQSDVAEADAEVADEGNEADSSPAVTDSDDTPETATSKGVQARIDELTRLRRDAERDRDQWRDFAQRQQAQPEPAKEPEQPEVPKSLADFNYDEAQYRDHLFGIAEKRAEKAAEGVASKWHQEQQALVNRQTFEARAAKFSQTVDDYESVANYAPISDQVASIVMDFEDGPELAYYLGKNPDVATRISGLSERMASAELGRISNRLSSQKSKPKIVSKAPPPPKKLEGSDPGVKGRIDDPKLSDAEFDKLRRKQIAAR